MNRKRIEKITSLMFKDKKLRRAIVRKSFVWFFYFYYGEYIDCEMAPFHERMFAIAEDTDVLNALIATFRDSAKSTILSEAFPIWAILGEQRLKHILIESRTQHQARGHLRNIREVLEKNSILKDDLGPFQEEGGGPWSTSSLYLPKYGARITAASLEQDIRGIKDKQYRPQLIICDDIESYDSIRTQEARDKTYEWFMGELVPAGGRRARIFILSNLLHPDGIMKRQLRKIEAGNMLGTYLEVPISDENGNPTWPGKFPTREAVEEYRRMKGFDENSWLKEFMLQFPHGEYQIIRREWIKREPIPPRTEEYGYRSSAIGIDLATSPKETADYTAMVFFDVFGYGKTRKIYVRPEFVNERLEPGEIVRRIVSLAKSLGNGVPVPVYAEKANLEAFAAGILKDEGITVETLKAGLDKETRLRAVAAPLQLRQVLLAPDCPELLVAQIVGYGSEKHDDLLDAFTVGVLKVLEKATEYKDGYGMLEYMRGEYEKTIKAGPGIPTDLAGWVQLYKNQQNRWW